MCLESRERGENAEPFRDCLHSSESPFSLSADRPWSTGYTTLYSHRLPPLMPYPPRLAWGRPEPQVPLVPLSGTATCLAGRVWETGPVLWNCSFLSPRRTSQNTNPCQGVSGLQAVPPHWEFHPRAPTPLHPPHATPQVSAASFSGPQQQSRSAKCIIYSKKASLDQTSTRGRTLSNNVEKGHSEKTV